MHPQFSFSLKMAYTVANVSDTPIPRYTERTIEHHYMQ